jgi:hypothetical protein
MLAVSAAGWHGRIQSIAELGPGDSLGIGLAGLLSGATRLWALDVVAYATACSNRDVLNGLLELFLSRAEVPGGNEFPGVRPKIEDGIVPSSIIAVEPAEIRRRYQAIIGALEGASAPVQVAYQVPWHRMSADSVRHVEMLFSQAVLEHVEDLEETYAAMARWVSPGGVVSHVIDFRSHGITKSWDGHRAYPEGLWRIAVGKRPYLLNRRAPSDHLELLEKAGFRVLHLNRYLRRPDLSRGSLARKFRVWSDADLETEGMHVIAERVA